ELVLRARSVVNGSLLYKLGSGGMFPNDEIPSRDRFCDCSGFVCWVLHLSRKTDIPFYKQFGGWISENVMKKVIHCSLGNYNKFHAAIQETTPTVFNRPDAAWGRFVG